MSIKKVDVTLAFEKKNKETGHLEFSHCYTSTWIMTDMFCVSCGKQGVYKEDTEADYYVGVKHVCSYCSATWSSHLFEKGTNYPIFQQLAYYRINAKDNKHESRQGN